MMPEVKGDANQNDDLEPIKNEAVAQSIFLFSIRTSVYRKIPILDRYLDHQNDSREVQYVE